MTWFGKFVIMAVAIAIICFAIGIASLSGGHSEAPQVTTATEAPTARPPSSAAATQAPVSGPEFPIPEDEEAFIATVASAARAYKAGANEFQKSASRGERAAALARIVSARSVNGWVGIVSKMETTHSRNGVLVLTVPGNKSIQIETLNNDFLGVGTLIPFGSELFNRVSSLSVGDRVVFDGIFGASSDDHIEELSLREEGSMLNPEFLMKFTSIQLESVAMAAIRDSAEKPVTQETATENKPEATVAAPATVQQCLKYGQPTSFRGVVSIEALPGPPSFISARNGDGLQPIWILGLHQDAVCISEDRESGDPAVNDAPSIQLLLTDVQYDKFLPMVGRLVEIAGTLPRAERAHHYRSVLLQVSDIQPAWAK
jgi:Domain of unknown function (DUF4431)